ncbi:hypothetical protein JYK00_02470 [Thermosipho ferrireducens]|uniref:Uncharacterized protein n=1 Tax=Thermosipho ferrireducens TaxID=2571116 RepID=A0ABX7S8Z2_9BACT|nr:hypothetical protein [Thermosipho ferrireducens]QTA38408.1 hypothetical protein JYK00_02470 [Thermosipho ferrireducens]
MKIVMSILFSIFGLFVPESIWVTQEGYYISQMGKLYTADGSVLYQSRMGNYVIENLVDPRGIYVENETLWIADKDRLIEYSLKSHTYKIYTPVTGSAKYLNDVVKYNGEMYVSDTYGDTIYILRENELYPVLSIAYPNGLSTDGEYLYIVSFTDPASLFVSDGNKVVKKMVLKGISYGDGLAYDRKNDLFFVSGYESGNIGVFTRDGRFLYEFSGLGKPADLFFDEKNEILYVPDMENGKLTALKVEIK